jgi:hypothetical protein
VTQLYPKSNVKVEVILWPTIRLPVRLGVRHSNGTRDQFFPFYLWLFLDSYGFVDAGRPLWRENGSVICSAMTQVQFEIILRPTVCRPVGLSPLFDNYFLSSRCAAPWSISSMNRRIQPEIKVQSQSYVNVGRNFLIYRWEGCMWSIQCNVEFGYQLSICSETKKNLDRVGRWQDLPDATDFGHQHL